MGLKAMIREAQAVPCPAREIPAAERTPDQVVDAGVKAVVHSPDAVALALHACNVVPILKPVMKMFIAQFVKRNSPAG